MGDLAPYLKFQGTVRRALAERTAYTNQDPSLAPAAVLLLFYVKDEQYCILFNKRSETVEHHKGEISFPGGAKDAEDEDFLATALREAEEEMGIRPQDVTTLGQLDDVATRSQYGVKVFVGTIPYPYAFRPSADEIAEVLEVPFEFLASPQNLRHEMRWEHGKQTPGYSYVYGEHLIWGATAKIVHQFVELVDGGLGEARS
jgi:8-oxo-dGTP pyrophosphatase MutT (NUDIX family)